jgi:undecaprenyl-diphosphatase
MGNGYVDAIILGIVEGLTEFLPVSSTGHLILAGRLLGESGPLSGPLRDTFDVMIQLGAILAVLVVYFRTFWTAVVTLPTSAASRHFALSVLVAFIPAVVLGLALHDFIKSVLFSPWVVCASLVLGGILILWIERRLPASHHEDSKHLPLPLCLRIGLFQCLALVPGVSRSGATIIGALLMRVDRKAAAEFSFFLAVPTMLGAFVLDAYKSRAVIMASGSGIPLIAVGFVVSFICALFIVETLIGFIGRHGFAPFAWYRIAVGLLMAGLLAAGVI